MKNVMPKHNPLKSVKESPVSKDCRELLLLNEIEHWRVGVMNGRFTPFGGGPSRVVKTGTKGHSDLVFLLQDGSGRTVYLETKRPVGGRQSPDQCDFEAMCIKRNAPYFIVSSVQDLAEILEAYGMLKIRM